MNLNPIKISFICLFSMICIQIGAANAETHPHLAFFIPQADAFRLLNVASAREVADDFGVDIQVIDFKNDFDYLRSALKHIDTRRVDALILPFAPETDEKSFEIIDAQQLPAFVINRDNTPLAFPPRTKYQYWLGRVVADDQARLIALANQLISMTDENELHVLILDNRPDRWEKTSCLQFETILAYNRKVKTILFKQADGDPEKVADQFQALYVREPKINMVLCMEVGVGATIDRTIKQMGLKQQILTGAVGRHKNGINAVKAGELDAIVGGYGFEGGLATLLLYDYLNGYDFNDQGTVFFSPLDTLHAKNLSADKLKWAYSSIDIDYRRFSKAHHSKPPGFDIHKVAELKQAVRLENIADLKLTPEELEWLDRQDDIRLAFPKMRPPLTFLDEQGHPEGIGARIVQLLNHRLDRKMRIVPVDLNEIDGLINDKKIDAVLDVASTDSRTAINLTHPYLAVPYYFVGLRDGPYYSRTSDFVGKPIAVDPVAIIENPFIHKHPQRFVISDNARAAFEALSKGVVDGAVVNWATAEYLLKDPRFHNLQLQSPLSKLPTVYTIGVRTELTTLQTILNKAVDAVTEKERENIRQQWLGDEYAKALQQGQEGRINYSLKEIAWLHKHPIIHVAAQSEERPFFFKISSKDKPTFSDFAGIAHDYLNIITAQLGIRLEMVSEKNAPFLKDMPGTADVDLLPVVRLPIADDSVTRLTIPYGTARPFIFTGDDKDTIFSLNDLAGKPVAVVSDKRTVSLLEIHYPEIRLIVESNIGNGLKRLLQKDVEAIISDLDQTYDYINRYVLLGIKAVRPLPFDTTAVQMGIRPDRPELHDLIKKTLAAIPVHQHLAIRERWLSKKTTQAIRKTGLIQLSLTIQEKGWLKNHTAVRILCGFQPPYHYLQQGEPNGIAVLYLKQILEDLGLKPVFVPPNPAYELHNRQPDAVYQSEGIDIIPTALNAPGYIKKSDGYTLTDTYLTFRPVIYTHKDKHFNGSLNDLAGKTIVVEARYQDVIRGLFDAKILTVPTIQNALDEVACGRADAFCGNLRSGSFFISSDGLPDWGGGNRSNLKVTDSLRNDAFPVAMAVRSDWPELTRMINKSLKAMSPERHRSLQQKVLPVRFEYGIDSILFWRILGSLAGFLMLLPLYALVKKIFSAGKALKQKKIFDNLRKGEAKSLQIVENTSAYIFTYDMEARLTYVSPSVEELAAENKNRLVGGPLSELIHALDLERVSKTLDDLISHKKVKDVEYRLNASNDSYRWVRSSLALVYDQDGRPDYVVCVAADITTWKQFEERIFKSLVASERAGQARANFVSDMSNEVSTLLNNMLGLTSSALSTNLPPNLYDCITNIDTTAKSLLTITNEILDVTNLKIGKLEMRSKDFNLNDVLKELATMTALKAYKKALTLIIDLDPQTPVALIGDSIRLEQILLNLAHNAIKFTTKGEVTITIKPEKVDNRRVALRFDIQDSGMGFSKEEQEKINNLFNRSDPIDLEKYSGMGLGLAICKNLCTMMKGQISFESQHGSGSTFSIAIPFARSLENNQQQVNIPQELKHNRILIVDADQKSRIVLKSFLDAHDFNVTVMPPDLLSQTDDSKTFALILFDIGKSTKADVETFLKFRETSPWDTSTKIITMREPSLKTSVFKTENIPWDIAIDGWVQKPILPFELLDIIVTVMTATVAQKLPQPSFEAVTPVLPVRQSGKSDFADKLGADARQSISKDDALIVNWEENYDDWENDVPVQYRQSENLIFQDKEFIDGDQPIPWEEQLEAIDQDNFLTEPSESDNLDDNLLNNHLIADDSVNPDTQKLQKVLEAISIVKEIEYEVIASRKNGNKKK